MGLKVTDSKGASSTDAVAITVGNTAPVGDDLLALPGPSLEGGTDDLLQRQRHGHAGRHHPGQPAHWSLVLHHCPSACHAHTLQSFTGVSGGSFAAPDHEYPSYLELTLTAADSGGLTDTQAVRLDPRTVILSMGSSPSGLTLALNGAARTTPFAATVIEGSANTISAPTPQTLAGATYDFRSWSDGGAGTHGITAAASRTLTATYARR